MKEERSKIVVQWLVPLGFMAIIIVIMFFNFFTTIKMEGVTSTEKDMIRIAEKYSQKLASDVHKVVTAGKTASSILAEINVPDKEMITAVTKSLLENTYAYAVVYRTGDMGIRSNGKSIDLRDSNYFRAICNAEETKYIYVKDDGITGEEAILIVIPLKNSASRSLLIYYPMDRVEELTRVYMEFDTESFSAVVNVDGTILHRGNVKSEFIAGDNLWKEIESEYENEVSKAKIQIRNTVPGSMEASVGEEKRTLIFVPLKINEWSLVIGVNQNYVDKIENQHWKRTSGMLYQLVGVIAIFLISLVVINIITKNKTEENDRLLREKADTDLLTGLNNKLATERKIKEYIAKNPKTLGMMFVLDIDNFKKINDTLGHAFGDEVLRSLGKQISSVFRVTDIVGRTGGDEFTIFLKFLKDDSNAMNEADKLVRFFEDFVAGEYVKYSATASIGAAVFPADGADFENLYKAADKALYKAKRRGKNQLAFYDDRDRGGKQDTEDMIEEDFGNRSTPIDSH